MGWKMPACACILLLPTVAVDFVLFIAALVATLVEFRFCSQLNCNFTVVVVVVLV